MKTFIKKLTTRSVRSYGLHRCTLPGCNQMHRTLAEQILHEGQAEHCKYCGFGLTDIIPSTGKAVFCLACEIDGPGNYPRNKSEIN